MGFHTGTGAIFYLGLLLMASRNLNFPCSEAATLKQSRQVFGEVTEPSITTLSTEPSSTTEDELHQGPIGSETSESTTTDPTPDFQSSSVLPVTQPVPSQDKDIIAQQEHSSSESDSEDSSSTEESAGGGCGHAGHNSSESEESWSSSSESSSSSSGSESYEYEIHFEYGY